MARSFKPKTSHSNTPLARAVSMEGVVAEALSLSVPQQTSATSTPVRTKHAYKAPLLVHQHSKNQKTVLQKKRYLLMPLTSLASLTIRRNPPAKVHQARWDGLCALS